MRFWLVLIFSAFAVHMPAYAQHITLKGDAPQFSGATVPVETISNPFTGKYRTIDTLRFNSDGAFNLQFSCEKPTWLKIDFGIFRSRLYVEPGTTYVLELPPSMEKSETDIRNPFFRPLMVHLKVLREERANETVQGQDMNSRIFYFDTLIFSRNADLVLTRQRKKQFDADSLIRSIESRYEKDTSHFFMNYRKYRYGLSMLDSRDRMLDEVYETFLSAGEPDPYNPAYMDLFNRMYDKFLFYFSGTEDGSSLKQVINRKHDLAALRTVLKSHPAIPNDTLADMVILKEMNNLYYKDLFYREALLIILDSLKMNPSVPSFGVFAGEIIRELTHLAIGSFPPDFRLQDQHGVWRSLNDFRGKYIYLNICTTDNYSCMSEYPFLRELRQRHNEYLEIVTIMVCDTWERMKEFMSRNGYSWPALFYGNDEHLLQQYKVRAYPTAFLIGPDGRLIQSPATLATEGFEQQLFRIMRARGDL